MKHILLLGALLAAILALAAADTAQVPKISHIATRGGELVQSPDGRIAVTAGLELGQPAWAVTVGGQQVLAQGALGVELAAGNFRGPFALVGTERAASNSTWRPVWGNRSEVPDHYNGLTLKLAEASGRQRAFNVELRAYNEGVALRYVFPQQPGLERVTVKQRLTEYRFGADRTIYQCRNYEYGTKTIATMAKSEGNVTVAVRLAHRRRPRRFLAGLLGAQEERDRRHHGHAAFGGGGRPALPHLVGSAARRRDGGQTLREPVHRRELERAVRGG